MTASEDRLFLYRSIKWLEERDFENYFKMRFSPHFLKQKIHYYLCKHLLVLNLSNNF